VPVPCQKSPCPNARAWPSGPFAPLDTNNRRVQDRCAVRSHAEAALPEFVYVVAYPPEAADGLESRLAAVEYKRTGEDLERGMLEIQGPSQMKRLRSLRSVN
jgi:hypothetical protein